MSKILEALGIHALTNREALMEDLDELDNRTFEYLVLSCMSCLTEHIHKAMCDDCKDQHGGECPNPDDSTCPTTITDWLSMTCTHESLIPEEVTT